MTPPPTAAPPGRGAPPPGGVARRWLIVVGTGWAVLLLVLAYVSMRTDPPTVRDQRGIAEALPVLRRAAGDLVAAVGDTGVVEVGDLDVSHGCRLTPVRDGARARRDITVHVRAGEVPAVLDRIAAALPVGYRAGVSHRDDEHVLRADAGDFVAVRGAVESDGTVVRLRASTGCRPPGGAPTPAPVGSAPPELAATASALGLPAGPPTTVQEVPCPTGGIARTVLRQGPWARGDLGAALAPLISVATVTRVEPTTVAYRRGATSIVVTAADGAVRVAATTGC